MSAGLIAPCASTLDLTVVNGTIVPLRSQPALGSVTPVFQRRRNTSAELPEISYDTRMSPSRRQGIVALLSFVQVRPDWLSSNVRNVSPVGALRANARYRKVLPVGWSTADQASRMFALPGVTPPGVFSMDQCAGSPSFVPPANVVSSAFGSSLCFTRPASCSASQSTRPVSLAWLPSAPWKLLPGSGSGDRGSAADASAGAAHATTTATTHATGSLRTAMTGTVRRRRSPSPHPYRVICARPHSGASGHAVPAAG
jgi:hypothetical protein